MNTSVIIKPVARRRRRRYSEGFKAEVIRACQHPGVSIAVVALANGLNANLLRRWVANAERDVKPVIEAAPIINAQPSHTPVFLPLQLGAPTRGDPDRVVPRWHDDQGELAGSCGRGVRVVDA